MQKKDEMLMDLKQIRDLLAVKPAPPPPPPKGLWNEFKDFLDKYKVMGLAVAFIMGIYLGLLVQSLPRFAIARYWSCQLQTCRVSNTV